MKIKINGIECKASRGEMVLQVARRNDVYIPALCYHAKTGPAGKCRTCVVEAENMPGLKTSCNLEVQDGMKIKTDTEAVVNAQKVIVDLILASGDHNCLICEQNGQCELQDAAYYLGIETTSFDLPTEYRDLDVSSEFIAVDRAKCISCGRCVAGCNDTVANEIINFASRGYETKVIFDNDLPMGKSGCVQCGECVQLCPVGALIDKRSRGRGRAWELEKVETVCPYCGVGCQLELHVDRRTNKIVRVTGVEDSPTNNGMLCVKGRYGFDFVGSDERLTVPLIREDDKFREATWDEAIALVAEKLGKIKEAHGSDAIAGLASAKCTNEDNYAFQKFMRKEVGTNNVDHCARL